MRVLRSRPSFISALLIATGAALLSGCGGVAQRDAGGPSALAASPSSVSFGNVQKGKSANLSETLTNTGGSAATISAAGVSSNTFSISGLSLPVTLSPNQSVTFTATFTPTSTGAANATIAVTSNADNSPLSIALSGTGTAQGQLTASPSTLSFGNVVVGASSALQGTLKASGSSVTVSGASSDSNEFVVSGISLPITLSDGQSTSYTVTFKPAAAGAASATLSFSSDAGNSPTSQSLTGTGQAASSHTVDLAWDASGGSGIVGYNVYRGGASGGPYSKINSALDASTAFSDSNVNSGQTYYYVTTAVNGSGDESSYSNQAKAVIPTP